jgi:hypothetical protein
MAMESPMVTADVIEANEFPSLSNRFAVQAVPKTVVNDRVEILGAMDEERFLNEALRALPSADQ